MNERTAGKLLPEECSGKIFEASGLKFEPSIASDLWERIVQHKWLLSDMVGRDVGFRTACIDFLENMDQALEESMSYKRKEILNEMGAQAIGREIWDTISDFQPPKQLVQRRIILPLTETELCRKHGVIPPKTIIFFGPPGTGKTHFAKAIAGALSWWFVEIVPSMLMEDGTEKVGANLRRIMEKARGLQEAVVFIDEFDELGCHRDNADRLNKSITNEFLKQVPLFKEEAKKVILVCATNFIRQLDSALLRPGRFDCIIPVGCLNSEERETILKNYLARLNTGEVDLSQIVKRTARYTPADIRFLFEQVAQYAFEQEIAEKRDFKAGTDTILRIVEKVEPSLTEQIIDEFEKDRVFYSRT